MITFLKELLLKYKSERETNQALAPEFYKEERFIDKTINELKWENSSHKEKQERRRKVLAIIEGENFANENYPYNGYERKVIEFYDALILAKEEIESKILDINLEKLLALILIEMRSIDKNVRMRNIAHIDHKTFKEAIQRCIQLSKSDKKLIEELDKLHTKPVE